MNEGIPFIVYPVCLVISLIIIYFIIRGATYGTQNLKHNKMQTELLKAIALKQGVSQEEIKDIVDKVDHWQI